MHKLTKILLGILSLLGLLQVFWFIALVYPLGPISHFFHSQWLPRQWQANIGLTLGILSGLTFLYICLFACFSPPVNRQLTIKSKSGQLELSKKAVEKTISQALVDQHALKDVTVKTKFVGRQPQIKADIHATAIKAQQLDEQGLAIKTTAQQAIQSVFDLPVKTVNVTLTPAVADKQRSDQKRVI